MYKIRVLRSTGFNAVNIPNGINTLISSAQSYDDINLTITSPILSAVTLPLAFDAIKKVDYAIIWKGTEGVADFGDASDYWCYFADASKSIPEATDSFTLPLVPDFITMVGLGNIEIIDGITTRSTYALNNVDPSKLTSGDPYLAPSETMQLMTEWIGEGDDYKDYIDSTINIVATAQKDEAITAVSASADVTYPIPEYAEDGRFATYDLYDSTTTSNSRTFKSPGSMLFVYGTTAGNANTLLNQGLAKVRGMGLESAILHACRIPTKYADVETMYDVVGDDNIRQCYVLLMRGKWSSQQTLIDLKQLDDTDDKVAGVLNYSEYTKYGIMSASGESIEADPKDLMTTTNPVIKMVGDPRPDGKPYFRFEKINNNKTDEIEFFRNCIAGLPWKQTQLVFTEASGNALNTAKYEASRQIADYNYNQAQRGIGLQKEFAQQNYEQGVATQDLSLLSAGIDGALSTIGVGHGGGMFSGVQDAVSTAMRYVSRDLSYAQQKSAIAYDQLATVENYSTAKVADALSYGIMQNVVVPTVAFPFNTETLRDFYGNGVLVYRFWYTIDDLTRIGRILKAYGVKYTMKTELNHFIPEAGEDYCYIEAHGVTVGGNVPQWQANGIAMQLANGVRIWNKKPERIQ